MQKGASRKRTTYRGPITRSKSQARDNINKSSPNLKKHKKMQSIKNRKKRIDKSKTKVKSPKKKIRRKGDISKTTRCSRSESSKSSKSSNSSKKSFKTNKGYKEKAKNVSPSRKDTKIKRYCNSRSKSSSGSNGKKLKQMQKSKSNTFIKKISKRSRSSSNRSRVTTRSMSKNGMRILSSRTERKLNDERKFKKKRSLNRKTNICSYPRSCSEESYSSSKNSKKCRSKTSLFSDSSSVFKEPISKSCIKKRKNSYESEDSNESCKTKIERWNKKYMCKTKYKKSPNVYLSDFDCKYNTSQCCRNKSCKRKSRPRDYETSRTYSHGKYHTHSSNPNCNSSKRLRNYDDSNQCNQRHDDKNSRPRQCRRNTFSESCKRFNSGKSRCCDKKDCCLRKMSMYVQSSSNLSRDIEHNPFKYIRHSSKETPPTRKYPRKNYKYVSSSKHYMQPKFKEHSKRKLSDQSKASYQSNSIANSIDSTKSYTGIKQRCKSANSSKGSIKSCESELSNYSIKRPTSAYIFFYQEAYKYASQSGCITTIKEFASLCGQKWNSMSHRDKQRYEDLASLDRRRYHMQRGR